MQSHPGNRCATARRGFSLDAKSIKSSLSSVRAVADRTRFDDAVIQSLPRNCGPLRLE